MENTLSNIIKQLQPVKGMLLMDSEGNLYFLISYKVVEKERVEVKKWFGKKIQERDYISTLQLSKYGTITYTCSDSDQASMRRKVHDLVEDRIRYLRMSKCLSDIGYTIKKK